jgi:hypothetical protein
MEEVRRRRGVQRDERGESQHQLRRRVQLRFDGAGRGYRSENVEQRSCFLVNHRMVRS